MKIVYVLGGNYAPNGMSCVLTQKINWLAVNTDYDIYVVLTERPDLPMYYPVHESVKCVNFNIGFDELDTMPLLRKLYAFKRKQSHYKTSFTEYLMHLRPDIVVCTVRRELSFINNIPDGSKKIGEIHFPKSHYREFKNRLFPSFINRLITRYWQTAMIDEIKRLSAFTVLSETDREEWTELDYVNVINNPLSVFPKSVVECNSKHVIAVGRYSWEKGYDMLFEAWKQVSVLFPDWHLDIYGPGDRELYAKMVVDMGLNTQITCHPADSHIFDRYSEAEFLVLSSRYEGFGLVIAEAMSCGRPTVCFDCPSGPRSIVNDSVDGLLAEKDNPKDLADKICWMIENDEKRKFMGYNARESARRFSEDVIMPQWVNLFERVIGGVGY